MKICFQFGNHLLKPKERGHTFSLSDILLKEKQHCYTHCATSLLTNVCLIKDVRDVCVCLFGIMDVS